MNALENVLVAGVTLLGMTVAGHGPPGHQEPGAPPATVFPAGLPHRYAAMALKGRHGAAAFRTKLIIRDTATGRALATVTAPRPWNSFCDVSGSQDGRTFVAETCKVSVTPLGGPVFEVATRPGRFCLLTVNGQGHVGRLRRLRIPVPGGDRLDGEALSPGGRKLAVASASGHDGVLARNPAIRLYDLGSGRRLRTWRWAGQADIIGRNGFDAASGPLSWTADGTTIAFPLLAGLQRRAQVRLLSTTAPGSNLRRSRRVVNFGAGPELLDQFGGELADPDSMITPDGSRIVASTLTVSGHGQNSTSRLTVSEFSVATGARITVLQSVTLPDSPEFFLPVLWSSPDGRTVIAGLGLGNGGIAPVGVMTSSGFTRLPGRWCGITELAF